MRNFERVEVMAYRWSGGFCGPSFGGGATWKQTSYRPSW